MGENRREITFPPFAPSSGWFLRLFASFISGEFSEEEAIRAANRAFQERGNAGLHEKGCSLKGFNRASIAGNDGVQMLLTVPVVGGSRSLRSCHDPDGVMLSDHGNWRHTHLGTLEALYGKTPFFIYLMPRIKEIYESEIFSLRDFNLAIYKLFSSFILQEIPVETLPKLIKPELNDAGVPDTGNVVKRGREVARLIDPELSIIDPLMKFGPETLLTFYALLPIPHIPTRSKAPSQEP